jgi:hypothetical protein
MEGPSDRENCSGMHHESNCSDAVTHYTPAAGVTWNSPPSQKLECQSKTGQAAFQIPLSNMFYSDRNTKLLIDLKLTVAPNLKTKVSGVMREVAHLDIARVQLDCLHEIR